MDSNFNILNIDIKILVIILILMLSVLIFTPIYFRIKNGTNIIDFLTEHWPFYTILFYIGISPVSFAIVYKTCDNQVFMLFSFFMCLVSVVLLFSYNAQPRNRHIRNMAKNSFYRACYRNSRFDNKMKNEKSDNGDK